MSSLTINPDNPNPHDAPLCLVAAKILYFGVGGGIAEFERSVRVVGGDLTNVLERTIGVGRRVMRIDWS